MNTLQNHSIVPSCATIVAVSPDQYEAVLSVHADMWTSSVEEVLSMPDGYDTEAVNPEIDYYWD